MTKYQAGDKYGYMKLTGKSYMKPNSEGRDIRYVEVICRCGKIWFTPLTVIKNGYTKSCGCYGLEKRTASNTKHGMTLDGKLHPIYKSWWGMRSRCKGTSGGDLKNYFLRGIKMCEEWMDFNIFHEWAVENGWKVGLSLDRINNDGNYEPDNCRWATSEMQMRNRSNNFNLTAFGETKCLQAWVKDERCTVNSSTAIKHRLNLNLSPEDAISKPYKTHIKKRINSGKFA